MPGAATARAASTTRPYEASGGRTVQSSRFGVKKAPQSQLVEDLRQIETSNILLEVSFLRLPKVKAVTGLSKTSLYALIKERSFPAPVRLGP
jgi:hypothetical protein